MNVFVMTYILSYLMIHHSLTFGVHLQYKLEQLTVKIGLKTKLNVIIPNNTFITIFTMITFDLIIQILPVKASPTFYEQ